MNRVAYFEIQADQPEMAIAFYTAVFDWKFTKEPNVPIGYWRIENAGPNGGLLKRPGPLPPARSGTNAYVCSVQVDDFDSTAKLIMQNGGQVAMPRFAVPGKCWQGYFIDPQGNTFGVFQVDLNAK